MSFPEGKVERREPWAIRVQPGESIDHFIMRTQWEMPDAVVFFDWLPPIVDRETQYFGPPRTTLARIREEWMLRTVFPHSATTEVW